jgi:two-component system chemotaxis response regulator CheY
MKQILVIDDAATVRLYHRQLLHDAGWHTEEACNGVEALERVHAREDAFDLYIVDVNMPRLDGYGFVRSLRTLDSRHQAPVMMVSSEGQEGDARQAFGAGANTYLVKPARPHVLVLTASLLLGDVCTARCAAQGMSR